MGWSSPATLLGLPNVVLSWWGFRAFQTPKAPRKNPPLQHTTWTKKSPLKMKGSSFMFGGMWDIWGMFQGFLVDVCCEKPVQDGVFFVSKNFNIWSNRGINLWRNFAVGSVGSGSTKWSMYRYTRWWFQRCLIFTPTWGRFPCWLIFSTELKPPTSTCKNPSWYYSTSHGVLSAARFFSKDKATLKIATPRCHVGQGCITYQNLVSCRSSSFAQIACLKPTWLHQQYGLEDYPPWS